MLSAPLHLLNLSLQSSFSCDLYNLSDLLHGTVSSSTFKDLTSSGDEHYALFMVHRLFEPQGTVTPLADLISLIGIVLILYNVLPIHNTPFSLSAQFLKHTPIIKVTKLMSNRGSADSYLISPARRLGIQGPLPYLSALSKLRMGMLHRSHHLIKMLNRTLYHFASLGYRLKKTSSPWRPG